MLKIKNNIDLKELEKFGFFKLENHYYHRLNNNEDYLTVSISNRLLITRINYENIENILFDLINAGFVEKFK